MNQLFRILLISFSSVVFFFFACDSGQEANSAPDFETTLIDGSPFQLSDLGGQYVVLDFWGSWCGPCIREMPQLIALHRKFGSRVEFVTVALEKDDRRWRAVSEKAGFAWKYQIVEKAPVVLASSIARDYGVTEIPAKFIVTPEGKLIRGMDLEQMDAYLTASLN